MRILWRGDKTLGGSNNYIEVIDSVSSSYYHNAIYNNANSESGKYVEVKGVMCISINDERKHIERRVNKGVDLYFDSIFQLLNISNAEKSIYVAATTSLNNLNFYVPPYTEMIGDQWWNHGGSWRIINLNYSNSVSATLDAPFENFQLIATFEHDKVNLSWSKVMQRLIATKYEIECSYDNQNYHKIFGGNNNNLSFVHKDIPDETKKVRYRIRQCNDRWNLNGSWQYSEEVNLNQTPNISLTDSNTQLGRVSSEFAKTYSITDADNDTVTVTEKLDNKVKKTENVTLGQGRTIEITRDEWIRLANGSHKLIIEATDSKGAKSTVEYTFTKQENKVVVNLKMKADCDERPTKVLVTPTWQKEGAVIKVEACNNMNDEAPAWEDITDRVLINKPSFLSNESKTSEKWKIGIKITMTKNEGYNQEVSLSSIGGAYE